MKGEFRLQLLLILIKTSWLTYVIQGSGQDPALLIERDLGQTQISQETHECLETPQEELASVCGEWEVWVHLLDLLVYKPRQKGGRT